MEASLDLDDGPILRNMPEEPRQEQKPDNPVTVMEMLAIFFAEKAASDYTMGSLL